MLNSNYIHKINSLFTMPNLNKQAIEAFQLIIESADDWDLYKINPFQFAVQHQLDLHQCLDIFICASKIGLFQLEWNLVCPKCGAVTDHHESISGISCDSYHCATCNIDINTDLNDYVEITFSINPNFKSLKLEPYKDFSHYRRFNTTSSYIPPEGFLEYFISHAFNSFEVIPPGQSRELQFEADDSDVFRLVSLDKNFLFEFKIDDNIESANNFILIDLISSGFSSNEKIIKSGQVLIKINNHLSESTGVYLFKANQKKIDSFFEKENESEFHHFLTAKSLLNSQTFRDLFKLHSLTQNLSLKLSNLTILFTDLKGSTELYDKTGDIKAYSLVQKHFDYLKDCTHKYKGAIIKTIGDAIMATFSNADDAMKAAINMIDEIESMNDKGSGYPISIKVGIHSGSVLAVNANDTLDYFGQTVNTAARIQGLADGNEIYVSQSTFENSRLSDILTASGYSNEKQSVRLKGIENAVEVIKCSKEKIALSA